MQMKLFYTLLLTLSCVQAASAQLADGTDAPNAEIYDLQGNAYDLHEILNSGRSILLNFGRTDCQPCWSYHQLGVLQQLHEFYGPDGNDAMRVFWVESNPGSNVQCIYDNNGCNDESEGDWTADTEFPIINSNSLAGIFEISDYPTLIHICPNREMTDLGTVAISTIVGLNDCAEGAVNARLLDDNLPAGGQCGTQTLVPEVRLQNGGSEELTEVIVRLRRGSQILETIAWTGSLETFESTVLYFEEVELSENGVYSIVAEQPNDQDEDDVPEDNLIANPVAFAQTTNSNLATLEIQADQYPEEMFWALLRDGELLYYRGNPDAVDVDLPASLYTGQGALYTETLPLAQDGCYRFVFADDYGDGLCCGVGEGYFRLTDSNGEILAEGAEFGELSDHFFALQNGTGVLNDARILEYSGTEGYFCESIDYSAILLVRNEGSNEMNSARVEVRSGNGQVLSTTEWTGAVEPGGFAGITTETILVTESELPLLVELTEVNGEPDLYTFANSTPVPLGGSVAATGEPLLTLELALDVYYWEVYWEILASDGSIAASGGNELVGPNGAGLEVATPDDPGAYTTHFVSETFQLPANDCYTLRFVDDYADGFGLEIDTASFRLLDAEGNELLYENMLDVSFADYEGGAIQTDFIIGTTVPEPVSDLRLFPNPAGEFAHLQFYLEEATELDIEVTDLTGRRVHFQQNSFSSGAHTVALEVSEFLPGIYFVRVPGRTLRLAVQ